MPPELQLRTQCAVGGRSGGNMTEATVPLTCEPVGEEAIKVALRLKGHQGEVYR